MPGVGDVGVDFGLEVVVDGGSVFGVSRRRLVSVSWVTRLGGRGTFSLSGGWGRVWVCLWQ